MPIVHARDLPANALLADYSRMPGCYSDCFSTDVASEIDLSGYVAAFYTTPLFKLERLILRLALSVPSTDREARQLADDEIDRFSAWDVERRSESQLLMCDRSGRIRSWFMVRPDPTGKSDTTQLFFGSAVVHALRGPSGGRGPGARILLGSHKFYSRMLLSAAASRLSHTKRPVSGQISDRFDDALR